MTSTAGTTSSMQTKRILIGVTGSVAAVKIPELVVRIIRMSTNTSSTSTSSSTTTTRSPSHTSQPCTNSTTDDLATGLRHGYVGSQVKEEEKGSCEKNIGTISSGRHDVQKKTNREKEEGDADSLNKGGELEKRASNRNNSTSRKRKQTWQQIPGVLLPRTTSTPIIIPTKYLIKVILTRGGQNFWNKASHYDPKWWMEMQTILVEQQQKHRKKQQQQHDDDFLNEEEISKQRQSSSRNNNDNDHHEEPILQIYEPLDEWSYWDQMGDPVLHIDLRNWADLFIIAPLSAHCLAKFANGYCDDTLSCIVRAWEYNNSDRQPKNGHPPEMNRIKIIKPILLAPAMNTAMWDHPLTNQQLTTIQNFAQVCVSNSDSNNHNNNNSDVVTVIAPQTKLLACGEMGLGAMASIDIILQHIISKMHP